MQACFEAQETVFLVSKLTLWSLLVKESYTVKPTNGKKLYGDTLPNNAHYNNRLRLVRATEISTENTTCNNLEKWTKFVLCFNSSS